MQPLQITGKQLIAIGYPQSPAIALAMELAAAAFTETEAAAALALLQHIVQTPGAFAQDPHWQPLAEKLLYNPMNSTISLQQPVHYAIYGGDFIEQGARAQMDTAVQLPVAVAGALMPDAHQGYGLPIGGVLAARNAVIPYGVGVDIGCRMCLSILDIPVDHFTGNEAQYKRELIAQTKFGAGNGFRGQYKADHAVLENPSFNSTPFVKQLHDRAYAQLGTSGGGNHFVEWGVLEILTVNNDWHLPLGQYLALLSHSGSRGLGATIAGHYTRLAKELCPLPKEAANLAYLDLDTAEGQEYWLAMNLAGDYASACHEVIHNKLVTAMGAQTLARVENHHNFAWKEMLHGEEVIVHRKGATPAGEGVLGIIPGSMTAPGFLVRGKGDAASLNSASHGAGRQMSRTAAEKAFTQQQLRDVLKAHNVTLIGGGLDEAPGAYKDIRTVMAAQTSLVEVLAQFTPRMVRMADDGSRED